MANPKRPPSDWASLLKTDFYIKNLIRYVESQNAKLPQRISSSRPEHPCQVHKDKENDLFCVDCAAVICHLCAGISHRGCGQVVPVDEAASDRRATTQIWISGMKAKLKDTSSLQKSREKCINQIERQRLETEAAIKARGQELRKLVTQSEEELLKVLDTHYKSVQEKFIVHVYRFEDRLDILKQNMESLPETLRSISDYELLSGDILEKVKMKMNVEDSDVKSYHTFLKGLANIRLNFQRSDTPKFNLGDILVNIEEVDTESGATRHICEEKTSILDRLRGVKNKKQQMQGEIIPTVAVRDNEINPANVPSSVIRKPEPPPRVPHKMVARTEVKKAITFLQRQERAAPPPVPQHSESIEELPGEDGAVFVRFKRENRNAAQNVTNNGSSSVERGTNLNESLEPGITPLRTIRCRFREDEQAPKLRDLIILSPNNTVVVTDWVNQCVKAIYVRRDRDNRLSVGGKPWAITQLTDNMCAVSLPLAQQICLLKIFPTLILQNSFMTSKKYCGLAALNSSTLVASGGSDPPSVDIINLYGEVLKTFVNDSQGQPMFMYPAYVNVTPRMDILVSDRKLGAVFSLTHKGEVKFRFHPDHPRRLQQPSGVTTDPSGRVLVAESRGLLSLTASGQFSHPVVRPQDELLSDPRGVAQDSEANIYVTSHDDSVLVLAQKDLLRWK
ncbi:uncharacterized protein LOC101859079 [Aplysia californica]|uniref:Uncharacterized protein LOC101859079 n=1 Tax=Aplysia californica TaxID=6500 RepID=A0ABM1AFV8_APLCA|nr:uncharacterized protein LOC101859079 [Aplysia californica]